MIRCVVAHDHVLLRQGLRRLLDDEADIEVVAEAGNEAETAAAKAILTRLRTGDLVDGFTARDIHRHNWSNFVDRGHIQVGLDLLVDLDYLAASSAAIGDRGGRPKITYQVNPRART